MRPTGSDRLVPLALPGPLPGLYFYGASINVFRQIGAILLIGIVVVFVVTASAVLTLIVVPALNATLARRARSPQ